MANVDQKAYLKKYLDHDHSKKRKKRRRDDSSSYSDRVKIIDDDCGYKHKRDYDEDNELLLTGEDAPQIVGIVDDRPPELKTAEDFRSNSKWRSVSSSNNNSSRDRERRRSQTPPQNRKDYSPRRTDGDRKDGVRRRRDSDDLSPVRRRHGAELKRSTSNVRSEKRFSYSNAGHAQRRDTGKDYHHREYNRKANPSCSSSMTRFQSSPQTRDAARGDDRNHKKSAENGQSASYRVREARTDNDPRYKPYDIPNKFNPFKSNPTPSYMQQFKDPYSQKDSYRQRLLSVGKSSNPFRSNPLPSISPLPDRHGDDRKFSRSQKSADFRNHHEGSGYKSTSLNGSSSLNTHSGKTLYNPFKLDVKKRETSPVSLARSGLQKKSDFIRSEKAEKYRDNRFTTEKTRDILYSSSHTSRFRSRSPLKSEIRGHVNKTSNINDRSKYASNKLPLGQRDGEYGWYNSTMTTDTSRKPLSSVVADIKYRPASDYPSSEARKSRWEGSTRDRR